MSTANIDLEFVWVTTLVGLVLSNVTCGLIIWVWLRHRSQRTTALKIIAYVSFYGLLYSLTWTINLILTMFLMDRNSIDRTRIIQPVCYVLNPVKVFSNLMWFAWNGLIINLLHAEIKNVRFDQKRLERFIDKIYHPIIIVLAIILALLPFSEPDIYKMQENSQLFTCEIRQTESVSSSIFYLAIYVMPMWLLAFYCIYVYIDVYLQFKRLKLNLPNGYNKMIYQPVMIALTWVWPSVAYFESICGCEIKTVLQEVFILSQGMTIFLQSLVFLNQIQKVHPINLCLDDADDNRLLIKP